MASGPPYMFKDFKKDFEKIQNKTEWSLNIFLTLDESIVKPNREEVKRCAAGLVSSLSGLPEQATEFLLKLCQDGSPVKENYGKKGLTSVPTSVTTDSRNGGRSHPQPTPSGSLPTTGTGRSSDRHVNIGNRLVSDIGANTFPRNRRAQEESGWQDNQDPEKSLSQPEAPRDADFLLTLLRKLKDFIDTEGVEHGTDGPDMKTASEKMKQGVLYTAAVKDSFVAYMRNEQERQNKMKKDFHIQVSENDQLKKDLESSQQQLQQKQAAIITLEESSNKLAGENVDLQHKMKTLQDENKKLDAYWRHLEGYIKKMTKDCEEKEQQYKNVLRDKEIQLETAKKELDDLKNRLSKIAGDKMSAGNSDITDLSDPDRPMKLGERFGSMYDDEWTDAFIVLTDTLKKAPQDAVCYLLSVLQDSFKFCQDVRDQQMTALNHILLFPGQPEDPQFLGQFGQMRIHSRDMNEVLKVRRLVSAQSFHVVRQQWVDLEQEKAKQSKEESEILTQCMPYYMKCVELCWLMVLHNPPMHITFDLQQGDKFDLGLYREYGTAGDKYDFLVWPPLFVEENGGLLAKGVAQPVPGKRSKRP